MQMNRISFFSFIALLFLRGVALAQSDSSNFKFSGFQLDLFSSFYLPLNSTDQASLQKYVPEDPMLYNDLKEYKPSNATFISGSFFDGMAGGRVFFSKKNRPRSEFFVGARIGEYLATGVNYSKADPEDTLTEYIDPQFGTKKYVIRTYSSDYYFTIKGSRLYVPVGFNFTTNRKKLFWFSAGAELTPFLLFGHIFTSHYSTFVTEHIVEEGKRPQGFGTYMAGIGNTNLQRIKGIGFGFYFGIPLAVYIHPFRKETNGLQKLNLFISVMPLFAYSSNKYTDAVNSGGISVGTGIRINLNK
jgi:hypothetical protein